MCGCSDPAWSTEGHRPVLGGKSVTVQLRDALSGLGYSLGVDLAYFWDADAPHNEAAWSGRFWRALQACTAAGWSPP